jgi:methyl-accepting chemotaxis protein
MTIRARLTSWYAGILIASLLLMGAGTYREIHEQMVRHPNHHSAIEHALGETGEMIFQVGLPAVGLGLLGGWWLTRRVLSPVAKLTDAIKTIHEHNLRQPLPRANNGDELDQLAKVFNDMLGRLDDSFNRIREFTLHASHELKRRSRCSARKSRRPCAMNRYRRWNEGGWRTGWMNCAGSRASWMV